MPFRIPDRDYELIHIEYGQSWHGFRKFNDPLDVYRDHGFQIALAWVQDSSGVWAFETKWVVDPTGLESLQSYYKTLMPDAEVVINLLNPVALVR